MLAKCISGSESRHVDGGPNARKFRAACAVDLAFRTYALGADLPLRTTGKLFAPAMLRVDRNTTMLVGCARTRTTMVFAQLKRRRQLKESRILHHETWRRCDGLRRASALLRKARSGPCLSNKKKAPTKNEAKYLRAWPDLAERWGVSRATAYRIVGTILPVMEVGQNRLVPLDAVEQYERDHTRLDSERRP